MGADVNAKTTKGKSALWYVLEDGNLDFVKLLVDQGVDLLAVNAYGLTPEKAARNAGHWKVADFLESEMAKRAKETGP